MSFVWGCVCSEAQLLLYGLNSSLPASRLLFPTFSFPVRYEKVFFVCKNASVICKNAFFRVSKVFVYDGKHGMKFRVLVQVKADGGIIEAGDSTMKVKNANRVDIILKSATDFAGPINLAICTRSYEHYRLATGTISTRAST